MKDDKTYNQPVMKDNGTIYYDIGEYIKKSPTNKDTPLKIETSLLDYSYIALDEKNLNQINF
jgi:hypothetical protein